MRKLAKRVKREKGLARSRSRSTANGALNGHSQPPRDDSPSSSEYGSESNAAPEGNGLDYGDDEANIRAYEAAKAKNGSVYGVSLTHFETLWNAQSSKSLSGRPTQV